MGIKMVRYPCFLVEDAMLAKKTVKNQITLPKTIVARFGSVEYFDVSTDGDAITLRPLRRSRLEEIQTKLEQLGIAEPDVEDAVAWARKTA
jgi:hypothetical protein